MKSECILCIASCVSGAMTLVAAYFAKYLFSAHVNASQWNRNCFHIWGGGGEYVYNFEIFTVDFVLDNMFNILAGPATASR